MKTTAKTEEPEMEGKNMRRAERREKSKLKKEKRSRREVYDDEDAMWDEMYEDAA